jgi:ATP-binding protein involved in chromosome partitioning
MTDRKQRTDEILATLKTVKLPGHAAHGTVADRVRGLTHCDGAVKAELLLGDDGAATVRAAEAALKKLPWVREVRLSATDDAALKEAPAIKSIIAVASGKGGVGKSTVAVNLAAGLAARGLAVGLLDADIYGPSIPMMLGVRTEKPLVANINGKQMLSPVLAHGLKLMSMGFVVEEGKPVIWRGPMLHGALRQFFNDVAWGELDCMVVDLPPGTGDVALTMTQTIALSGAVIVSTPQQVAMLDAKKALQMFKETNVPVLGIVENMSGSVFGSGGALSWAEAEDVTALGTIPLDARTCSAGDEGIPAVLSKAPELAQPFQRMVAAVESALLRRNAEAPARRPLKLHP